MASESVPLTLSIDISLEPWMLKISTVAGLPATYNALPAKVTLLLRSVFTNIGVSPPLVPHFV